MKLTIDRVMKEFGDFPALHDVSLEVGSGELVALLGPSGSGKTTLLRLIAGLEYPTAGRILFGDINASRTRIQDRRVGFVFQNYALFKHMTVLDNVTFGLDVRSAKARLPRKQRHERALDLLRLVQLEGLEKRFPSQLSGGQRQRVALARALAIEPSVLLLDEPFGALDAQVRKELRTWLRELHDATGHTTVFVTHDQEEALELADRVVVMSQGQIEQADTPSGIFDRPASEFVVGFVGESSRLEGRIDRGSLKLGSLTVADDFGNCEDGAASVYVRPHSITLIEPGGSNFQGRVQSVRRTAARRILTFSTPAGAVDVETPLDCEIEAGEVRGLELSSWHVYREGQLLGSRA